ncbi:lysozyme [Bacillus pseudomycoides]|uniref:Lysozyme family protein n=3 Tax=Bacillus pseudomycoides TaxID=64104 RepID=A0AAJ2DM89_9BACI|nr:lysozyme family protein [Bacillus pseudomycoides]MDR4328855.1 lysozyme family protein [Bacillus pseudomycoides]MED1478044.1 lysozyme family protein [Bacillus pseudomycoides]PEJ27464.1 lysozyme [Bacillus pseudomycoides]
MDQLVASAKTVNLPQAVLRWQTMVEQECTAQGVPELVPYVLGIIMVESGGNSEQTPDIMQSSESQGRPMNSIDNPKESIHYGVMHLKGSFVDAKKYGINDLSAIVQTYNFGRAYIRWLASNNKQHSLPVADQYSKTVVAPSLGNTTGAMVRYSQPIAVAYNGGYRYKNGGNFFYAEIVKQYVNFDEGTGGGTLQPEGIGIAVSKYPVGYGVNLFTKPVNGLVRGSIKDKTPYLILAGYWLGGDENMLCLGNEQWVPQKNVDVQWFKAYSKYAPDYGINTYSAPGAPDGSYIDKVKGSVGYDIYSRKDGWIAIDNKRFVEEKHFDIR